MPVPFDSDVAQIYIHGRKMTRSEISTWTNVLKGQLNNLPSTKCILDLGSGTGRFSPTLAEQCRAMVIGVEPSSGMRAVAQEVSQHPNVRYVGGQAEAIPLASNSCDAAFLFLSMHHFTDLLTASREIARVVRVNGAIVIRTEFSDRPHMTYWHGLIPRGAEIDRGLYPAFVDVSSALHSAGIVIEEVRLVPYLASSSLRAYISRLPLLSISALRILGKAEVEYRLSQFDLQEAEMSQPVNEVGHLIICHRR
jgi:SAM-dependent methyltransferase